MNEDRESLLLAIKEAWDLVPGLSLSQLLDTVTPMPFCEMSTSELKKSMDDFIMQNQ